jgi:hypothetical protein
MTPFKSGTFASRNGVPDAVRDGNGKRIGSVWLVSAKDDAAAWWVAEVRVSVMGDVGVPLTIGSVMGRGPSPEAALDRALSAETGSALIDGVRLLNDDVRDYDALVVNG